MIQFLKKYIALMRRSLAVHMEYRVAMFIWMLSATFPLVMLAVWLSLAEDGPIAGFTAGDFVGYYLLSFYMRQMTSVWVAWELDYDIRHGDMSSKLLHPLNPIHEYVAFNLADKVIRGFMFTPVVIVVALLAPGVTFLVTPLNLLFFAIAVMGAWAMRYFFQFNLGLLGFWFSQALVLTDVFWMLFLLLGGGVAPIELLPEPLRTIAYHLPFRFMMSFPIEIMMGRLSVNEILVGFVSVAAWVVVLATVYRILWARGIRQFSAFGA
ncbi:MAG: ABC-2 family transporter protein [Anaerolineae bacterium]|nr:ABC-2 family transporter protein [Anaerolineae bacterium]